MTTDAIKASLAEPERHFVWSDLLRGEFRLSDLLAEHARQVAERVRAETPTWQPMETAPKDGSEILLQFGPPPNSPCPLVARWLCSLGWWADAGHEVEILAAPKGWLPLPPIAGAPR